jgi:Mn2+/Fe2+ NRAMP family transporter
MLGPGIVVAATGIGAGDMIAAAVSGARYGLLLLWAAALGAILKFCLNEGIARWQLATGTTLLEAWVSRFHRAVSIYFIIYLFLWSFIVAGALIAACGLAGHALLPVLPVEAWGVIHSLGAVILVYLGRYAVIEKVMKFFIAMMFLVVIVSSVLVQPDWSTVLASTFIPSVPAGSGKFILGVIGGVGGSVTLLSYGYWIREKKWRGTAYVKRARIDLAAAYILTGLFGIAIMIIAAGVKPEVMTGSEMVIGLADRLGSATGAVGRGIFLVGFWGAVFSSMLGVWQGVPYLFADFMKVYRNRRFDIEGEGDITASKYYRLYLLYLALPPLVLLFTGKPVWIVVIYSVVGAFFMPFLAGSLLYLNNRGDWLKKMKNRLAMNVMLILSLLLFLYLCLKELLEQF